MGAKQQGERSEPVTDPEQLLSLKEHLLTTWNQLPAEHQATMALAFLDTVKESEWGPWLREAIEFQWPAEPIEHQPEPEFPEWMERVDRAVWRIAG